MENRSGAMPIKSYFLWKNSWDSSLAKKGRSSGIWSEYILKCCMYMNLPLRENPAFSTYHYPCGQLPCILGGSSMPGGRMWQAFIRWTMPFPSFSFSPNSSPYLPSKQAVKIRFPKGSAFSLHHRTPRLSSNTVSLKIQQSSSYQGLI